MISSKATKDNPRERYSWKWTITKALYEKGFSAKDILDIYRLVDWLMMLPDDLTNQFTQNLIAYEEEQKMPYVTSAERIGIEKGKLEGRSEGLDIGQLNNGNKSDPLASFFEYNCIFKQAFHLLFLGFDTFLKILQWIGGFRRWGLKQWGLK